MIMAFDKSSPVAAIGSFQVSDDRLSHTIDCHGGFEVKFADFCHHDTRFSYCVLTIFV